MIKDLCETIKEYGLWYTVYEELLPMWNVRFKVKRWKPILVLWEEWQDYSETRYAGFLTVCESTIEEFKEYLIKADDERGKRETYS